MMSVKCSASSGIRTTSISSGESAPLIRPSEQLGLAQVAKTFAAKRPSGKSPLPRSICTGMSPAPVLTLLFLIFAGRRDEVGADSSIVNEPDPEKSGAGVGSAYRTCQLASLVLEKEGVLR